jgi:transcriptional regulator with XRE-family HTH domain
MRARIDAAGLTQADLARLIPLSPAHLSRLANGIRQPTAELAERIDRILKAGGQLAALAQPEPVIPQQRSGLVRPLDDGDAERIRADVDHLVGLDIAHGSDGLVPVATRAFRTAADRLAQAGAAPTAAADLHSVAADLGALTSWVAADAMEHNLSRQVALEALALADIAGDRRLHEFLLSQLSMVAEHAGRGAEALAFADRSLSERPRSRRVQAMFHIRRARALGLLRATDEALDEWELARQLLEEAAEHPDDGVTYWLHESELAIHRAVILSEGGRAREGVEWSRRGVDLLPDQQGRDQVLFRAMHLEDLVLARAWRDAERVAVELVSWAGGARSARVPAILRRVLGVVCSPASRAPRGLQDAVRAALVAVSE